MSEICWIATIICITGTVVNVWRFNACFALWFIGEIVWAYIDLRQMVYSRMMLDLLGAMLAILGMWRNGIFGRAGK